MRTFFAVVFACLAASLAPALAFAGIFLAVGGKDALPTLALAFTGALVVAVAHTLFLGVPTSAWLLRIGRFRLRTMLLGGFVVGMVPVALWAQPYKYAGTQSSSWSGGVQKLDNGVPTLAGLVDYLQLVGYAGALGALGGIAFYFTYKGIKPNNSFKPKPLRGSA